jgi:hypothetical protein
MISARSVRIPARWHDGQRSRADSALFQLGPGPCGLTVTELLVSIDGDFVRLVQHHDGAPTKNFFYRTSDLVGRVEIEVAE